MNGGVEKPYPPNEGFSLGASDQEQTSESGRSVVEIELFVPAGFMAPQSPLGP